jgi:hypothetical protein
MSERINQYTSEEMRAVGLGNKIAAHTHSEVPAHVYEGSMIELITLLSNNETALEAFRELQRPEGVDEVVLIDNR